MKVEYWIKDEGKWRQVDRDEYFSFNGEREQRPSTWRLMLAQAILQKYRYM